MKRRCCTPDEDVCLKFSATPKQLQRTYSLIQGSQLVKYKVVNKILIHGGAVKVGGKCHFNRIYVQVSGRFIRVMSSRDWSSYRKHRFHLQHVR